MSWQDRLREAVRADPRTQDEIAHRAGIPPETLSRIMTGQSANPRFDTVVCIAQAIGVTVGSLLDEHLARGEENRSTSTARSRTSSGRFGSWNGSSTWWMRGRRRGNI